MNLIGIISDLLVFLLENTEIAFRSREFTKFTNYDKMKNKSKKNVTDKGDKDDNMFQNIHFNYDDNDENNNDNNNDDEKKKSVGASNNILDKKSINFKLFTKLILGINGLGIHATPQSSDRDGNEKFAADKEFADCDANENVKMFAKNEENGSKSNLDLFLDLQIGRIIEAILYKTENEINLDGTKDSINNNNSNTNEKEKTRKNSDKNVVRDLGLKIGDESGDYLNGILMGLSGILGPSSSIFLDGHIESSTPYFSSSPSFSTPSFPLQPPSPFSSLPPSLPSLSTLPSYFTRQLLLSSHRYCTQDWGTPHTLTKVIQSLTKLGIWQQISNTQLSDTISYYKRNLDLIYDDKEIISILTIFLPFFASKKNEIPFININSNSKMHLSNIMNEKTKNEMKSIVENLVQKVLSENLSDKKMGINGKDKTLNSRNDDKYHSKKVYMNSEIFFLIIETIKKIYIPDKILEKKNELKNDYNNDGNCNVENQRNENVKSDDIKISSQILSAETPVIPTATKSVEITEKEIIPLNMKIALTNGFSHAFHEFNDKEIISILQFFPTANIFWQDFTVEFSKDSNFERERGREKLSNLLSKILEIRSVEKSGNLNTEIIDKIFANFCVPIEMVNAENVHQNNENAATLLTTIEKSTESISHVKPVSQNTSPKYHLFPSWETLEELRELIPLLDTCSNYIPNVLWQCHKKKITIQTLMVRVSICFFNYLLLSLLFFYS